MLNNSITVLLVSFVCHIELQNFLNAPRIHIQCILIVIIPNLAYIQLYLLTSDCTIGLHRLLIIIDVDDEYDYYYYRTRWLLKT